MPQMDNSLNVSELLKRLGVVGDSKGSAPLLEEMRLAINLADLSDLVPPVPVAYGGAGFAVTSAPATFNKWSLHCLSPGGLSVVALAAGVPKGFRIWISDADPYAASVIRGKGDLTGGQATLSEFLQSAPAAVVAPAASYLHFFGDDAASVIPTFYVLPGQFFNIEATNDNQLLQQIMIQWKEYGGALSP